MEDISNKLVEEILKDDRATDDFDSCNIDFLIDHILNSHHWYVNQAILQILPLVQKVVEVHGTKHTELVIIQSLFQQISNEMLLHMKKEELVLFPYIKKLHQAELDRKEVERPTFGSIKSPISVIETEHDTAGIMLNRLSKLSNNYTPPDDACQTFRLLFDKLKEFDTDLHMHMHLENDILHPKAIELEVALLVG